MSNLGSIRRLEKEENIGGGIYILIADVKWIDAFPEVIDENIEDDITLLSPNVWLRMDFTEETLNFNETEDEESEGFISILLGLIPKDRLDTQRKLAAFRRKRVVALYFDANGSCKVLGSKEQPAIFDLVSVDHKESRADRNEQAIQIKTDGVNRCPFYQGSLPAAGSGGIVTILDQDGNVYTTVTAPGTFTIEVLTEIEDTIDSNTTTVTDPL